MSPGARVKGRHAAAVVLNGDKFASALGDGYGNLASARVQSVLDELLDDGGGTFDDLPCGDFVRHMKRENPHVSVAVRDQG